MAEPVQSKYLQLADDLQRRIVEGQLAVGERLPSIRQMASDAGVSLMTMVRAVQIVAGRGLVSSRPGDGTVVTGQAATPAARATDTVGFILAHHAGMGRLNQELLGDLQADLRGHDKRVEFEQINYPFDPAEVERFAAAGWQGAILTGAVQDHHVRAMHATGLPFVVAGTYNLTEPCTQARIDMETSTAAVFRRMFARGLKRVGLIVGRRDFYANRMAADLLEVESRVAGEPFDASHLVFDDTDGEDDEVVDRLVAQMGRPDGLWATGNMLDSVMRGLARHRLTPRRDLILAGMRNPIPRRDVPFSYELLFPRQWSASIVHALLDQIKRGDFADARTYSVPMPLIEPTQPPQRRRPSRPAAIV